MDSVCLRKNWIVILRLMKLHMCHLCVCVYEWIYTVNRFGIPFFLFVQWFYFAVPYVLQYRGGGKAAEPTELFWQYICWAKIQLVLAKCECQVSLQCDKYDAKLATKKAGAFKIMPSQQLITFLTLITLQSGTFVCTYRKCAKRKPIAPQNVSFCLSVMLSFCTWKQ